MNREQEPGETGWGTAGRLMCREGESRPAKKPGSTGPARACTCSFPAAALRPHSLSSGSISDAWRSRLWSLSYNSFNFTPARIPWPVGAGEAEELGVRCAQQRDSDSFHRYTTQGSVCIPFFPVTHCLRMPQEVTEMVPLKAG